MEKMVLWIYGSKRSIVSKGSILEPFIYKNCAMDPIDTIDLIYSEIHDTRWNKVYVSLNFYFNGP